MNYDTTLRPALCRFFAVVGPLIDYLFFWPVIAYHAMLDLGGGIMSWLALRDAPSTNDLLATIAAAGGWRVTAVPTAGSGSFTPAIVGGLFTSNSSGIGIVTFQIFPSDATIPPVTIGGFSYSVFTTFNDIHLVPPATNNGITTVQGFVSGSAAPEPIPEPTTMLLLLTGVVGAGVVKKRFTS